MNSMATIERLCRLPSEFRMGNISTHDLLHAIGIEPSSIDLNTVRAVLRSNPELINDWLRWSEDQRSTPGYYLLKENNKYIVGRIPGNEQKVFTDKIEACTDFIVKQVHQVW